MVDKTAIAFIAVGLSVGVVATFFIIFSSVVPLSTKDMDVLALASNNNNETKISTIVIPNTSIIETNYEPEIIKVVIGVNNTVRWINQGSISYGVKASDESDPGFFKATQNNNNNLLLPGQTFEYTFTKPGKFSYHSVPHPQMQGTIIVLEEGSSNDDLYQKIVKEKREQKVENTPLTIFVDRISPSNTVQVHAVHSFLVKNPSDAIISAYKVYPTWEGDEEDHHLTVLTDTDGNSISHTPISYDNMIYSFDAICPHADVTVKNGAIYGNETSKETVVHYGPQFSVQLYDGSPEIVYYNYSLGKLEQDEENGIYRLTFVTPYEVSVELSEGINMLSYGRANCAATDDSKLTMPYFDIIFKLD